MPVDLSLSGKIALVTGASRAIGIGASVARLFAQAGADVFFTYYTPYDQERPWGVRPEEPQMLLDELRRMGVRADASEADLADIAAPPNLFDQAELALGPVDILVNNATHDVEVDIFHLTDELLDQHYAVNVRGAVLMCQEFARRADRRADRRSDGRPGGRIINLVSGELLHPMVENLPYAITKGAIDALTITLSGELASRKITVNAVDPGATDTGWMPPEVKDWHLQHAPMGRIGQPVDAARLILFLASDLGEWVTGQIIHSRGGF